MGTETEGQYHQHTRGWGLCRSTNVESRSANFVHLPPDQAGLTQKTILLAARNFGFCRFPLKQLCVHLTLACGNTLKALEAPASPVLLAGISLPSTVLFSQRHGCLESMRAVR